MRRRALALLLLAAAALGLAACGGGGARPPRPRPRAARPRRAPPLRAPPLRPPGPLAPPARPPPPRAAPPGEPPPSCSRTPTTASPTTARKRPPPNGNAPARKSAPTRPSAPRETGPLPAPTCRSRPARDSSASPPPPQRQGRRLREDLRRAQLPRPHLRARQHADPRPLLPAGQRRQRLRPLRRAPRPAVRDAGAPRRGQVEADPALPDRLPGGRFAASRRLILLLQLAQQLDDAARDLVAGGADLLERAALRVGRSQSR